MTQRTIPLNAVRAFEAAARHLSITRAAAELHVTPAAVSHQVRALEDFLGVPLFRRENRSVLLTDAAQACLPELTQGLSLISQGLGRARRTRASGAITISVAPSFGAKWLMPRIERFREAWPGIDVRIDASPRLANFRDDDVDVAIRYGPGGYEGVNAERLVDEEVFPVCSPRLLEGEHPLRTPDDLRHHQLLHIDWGTYETWPDWEMWLLSAGVEGVDTSRGLRFTLSSMAVQAAIAGNGVALGSRVLVEDDLAAGRLVKPFEHSVPVDFCYYLVYPEDATADERLAAVIEWLKAEARRPAADA